MSFTITELTVIPMVLASLWKKTHKQDVCFSKEEWQHTIIRRPDDPLKAPITPMSKVEFYMMTIWCIAALKRQSPWCR